MENDYIKREYAINEIQEWATDLAHPEFIVKEDAVCVLKKLPSADVEPVRHGHWIEKNTNKDGTHNIYCNKCGKYRKSKGHANSWRVRHELLYCPYCGTKMDEWEQEHEDHNDIPEIHARHEQR